MSFLSEAELEHALMAQLRELGWATASDAEIGPDGRAPERDGHGVVILHQRLEAVIAWLNPHQPQEARPEAVARLAQSIFPAQLEEMSPSMTCLYHAS